MHGLPLSRRKFFALSGTAALGAFAPSWARACPELDKMPNSEKAQKEAANAINAFAFDLYRQLAGPDSQEKGNLFLSPYSIETALAMTSAGARGQTLEEMEKVLHLPKEPHTAFAELRGRLNRLEEEKRPYELTTANAIWAQENYPWEKDFIELTRKFYGSGLTKVDFAKSEAARKQINEWVEKATARKIKDLIPNGAITAMTKMVLANAIYFKSDWAYQFNKKLTKDAPFMLANGKKDEVPLMTLHTHLNYCERHLGGRTGLAVQVVELPYAGHELSMLVILPEAKRSLDLIPSRIDAEIFSNLALKKTDVNVFLPRFKAESSFGLNEPLKNLGMKSAFANADFTGLSSKGKELAISAVLHKAFVDVSEEGTEAAAATAVVVGDAKAASEPKEFRADRPFMYAIRDNISGAVLFLGRYVGPA